jgi:hypothetical protein
MKTGLCIKREAVADVTLLGGSHPNSDHNILLTSCVCLRTEILSASRKKCGVHTLISTAVKNRGISSTQSPANVALRSLDQPNVSFITTSREANSFKSSHPSLREAEQNNMTKGIKKECDRQ